MTGAVIVAAAIGLLRVLFSKRMVKSERWQATITPLASIIGSGFLVAGPILAHTMGTLAWLGITALCAIGYLFGEVMRYNIRHLEPTLAKPNRLTAGIEQLSDISLSIAYFISVAYYLNLFAAFFLKSLGIDDDIAIRAVAAAVIAGIGLVGLKGGLRSLERILIGAVGLKLALIGAISVGLIWLTTSNAISGNLAWPNISHATGWNELAILLGLVVMVQGFETSRYLGGEHSAELRIKTMRDSQVISAVIYITFVLLITQFFDLLPTGAIGETDVIELLAPLGFLAAPVLIVAALASQFSAGVADTNGSGGILSEALKGKLGIGAASFLTAVVAIGITWAFDILQIIAIASKAFVFYYGLQSLQAMRLALKAKEWARALMFGFAVAVALVIVLFAIPASA